MNRFFGRLAEPLILAALGLAGVAATIFLGIAEEVIEGDSQAIDHWLMQRLRHPGDPTTARGPAWLATASRDITALGDMTILALVVLAVSVFLLLARRPRMAGFVMAATISGAALVATLKGFFERDRPAFASPEVYLATSSFPSGHAAMSTLVYLTLAALLLNLVTDIRLKAYMLCVALTVSLMIGLSRIYLGVHWPSDVAAGWAIGAAWALAWWSLAQIFPDPVAPLPGTKANR